MKKEVLKLNINPLIIDWAIKTSGWDTKDFLTKIVVSEDVYTKWMNKIDNPTINQLKLISEKTKRPTALFFSSMVPEEKPLPKDFRLNPKKKGKFDKKTIMAIRKARKLQAILNELGENYLGDNFRDLKISIEDSPQNIALMLREKLGIDETIQKKSKTAYAFIKLIREKLEKEKLFNFQISMPLEDARGFALSDSFPRIIVINSKDIIEARIFTLAHELGHVLLGDTEIGTPDLDDTNKNEWWCNEFASSLLFPKEMATKIFEENRGNLTDYETLKRLSGKYKLSKSMLLYNMVKLKFITSLDYKEILEKYAKKELSVIRKVSGVGVSADKRCLNELGSNFISIVADNLDKKTITYSDALDYLSIKSRSFEKLVKRM